jgi:tetratricopeptide (TPR) repeat protein
VVGNYYISYIKHFIHIILFLLISFNGIAQYSDEQQHQIDSLNTIINSHNSNDTTLAGAYLSLSDIIYITNMDTIIPLCEKAIDIANNGMKEEQPIKVELSLNKTLGGAINNIGYYYYYKNDFIKSLDYWEKALSYRKKAKDLDGVASSYFSIAIVYGRYGNKKKELDFLLKSLRIRREINDLIGVHNCLASIGMLYTEQKDYTSGIEYCLKAVKIAKKAKDTLGIITGYNNLGYTNSLNGEINDAKNYYEKSLDLIMVLGVKKYSRKHSTVLNNLGSIYLALGDTTTGREYQHQTLELLEENGDFSSKLTLLVNIGMVELNQNNLKDAKARGLEAFKMAKAKGLPLDLKRAAGFMYKIYLKEKRFEQALEMRNLSIKMKDSIADTESIQSMARLKSQYEFEKAQIVKENEAKEKARLEKKQSSVQLNLLRHISIVWNSLKLRIH